MGSPIPVVVCGTKPEIGVKVAAALKPEYEAIYFVNSVDEGKKVLPILIDGKEPPSKEPDGVGTFNFSHRPLAVIFGRGYEATDINDMHVLCQNLSSAAAWFQGAPEEKEKLGQAPPGPNYAQITVAKLKGMLGQLKKEGKLGVDGMYYY